ncbi:hypothetical protein Tco_0229341 [Tanacetum coccineum]
MTITRSGMTPKAIEELVNRRVKKRWLLMEIARMYIPRLHEVSTTQLQVKGKIGVVGLTRWFEKMETVFHISNCPEKYQVKYATCTLLNIALTWWNSHKRAVGTEAAFTMSWRELMKLMAEVYCPRNKIQKIKPEL